MNWILMYLSIALGSYGTHTGMMSSGPFLTQHECEAYAEEVWTSKHWSKKPDIQNMYDSTSIIQHRELIDGNEGVFYLCVPMRKPRE